MGSGICETGWKNELVAYDFMDEAGVRRLAESELAEALKAKVPARITKYDMKESQEIASYFESSDKKYLDKEFTPGEGSLGKFDLAYTPAWKRIGKVTKRGEATLNNPFSLIQLLLKSRPEQAQTVFRRAERGAWIFRLCVRGKILEMAVDDYVPVNLEDEPLFTNSEEDKFVMLLKALAKSQGNYQCLLKLEFESVLSLVLFAPSLFVELSEKEPLPLKRLSRYSQQGSTLVGLSRSLTRDGIQPTCFYPIVHVGTYREFPQGLFKLTQISKEQVWKGKLSKFDTESWNYVSPQTAGRVAGFKLSGNSLGSCYLTAKDFRLNFQLVFVCLNFPRMSSSWTTVRSAPNVIHEARLSVDRKCTVVVSLYLLNKEVAHSSSTLLAVMYHSSAKRLVTCPVFYERLGEQKTFSIEAEPGTYSILFSAMWEVASSQTLLVHACSEGPLVLEQARVNKELVSAFAIGHAKQRTDASSGKRLLGMNPDDWIVTKDLFNESGIGYVVISLSRSSPKMLRVRVDSAKIEQEGFWLLCPSEGEYLVRKGDSLAVVFTLCSQLVSRRIQFPPQIAIDQVF